MCSQGPPNGTFESSHTNTHPFTDANCSSLSTRIAISLTEVKTRASPCRSVHFSGLTYVGMRRNIHQALIFSYVRGKKWMEIKRHKSK